ncbi:MAG: hypothetical protein K5927_02945 [Lachnospiraceae bacterium]|nr:hypothetical protein [Lachnospiraceae bacterium]
MTGLLFVAGLTLYVISLVLFAMKEFDAGFMCMVPASIFIIIGAIRYILKRRRSKKQGGKKR